MREAQDERKDDEGDENTKHDQIAAPHAAVALETDLTGERELGFWFPVSQGYFSIDLAAAAAPRAGACHRIGLSDCKRAGRVGSAGRVVSAERIGERGVGPADLDLAGDHGLHALGP